MPILVWGRHKRPQLKWDRPKTYKFWQSPHFQSSWEVLDQSFPGQSIVEICILVVDNSFLCPNWYFIGQGTFTTFPRAAATYLEEQQPHIWRSSSHISGRAAATYLDEQQPHICVKLRIMLNSAQLSLSWGLAELGNKKYEQSVVEICILVVIGPEEMPILVWGRRKRPPTKMGSTWDL